MKFAASISILLLVFVLAGAAHAQQPTDTDYLRYWPTPEQVRADIAGNAGDARPEEIEGRVAGRLLLLNGTIRAAFGGDVYVDRLPPAARKLQEAYHQAFVRIRDEKGEQYRLGGPCGFFDRLLHRCKWMNYDTARGAYEDDLEPTIETANLYFPQEYRQRFIDMSPGMQLRQWTAKNRAEAAASAGGQKSATRKGALKFALGSLVLLLPGILVLVLALKPLRRLKRYEFENMTSGGVVQFSDYDAAERHHRKKELLGLVVRYIAGPLLILGTLGVMFGTAVYVIG
jgi:hypothetical protein